MIEAMREQKLDEIVKSGRGDGKVGTLFSSKRLEDMTDGEISDATAEAGLWTDPEARRRMEAFENENPGGNEVFRQGRAAFMVVKDVIEKGRVIHSERRGNADSHFISAPARIDGTDDVVTVLVRRDANTQRMYLHSVTTKEWLLNARVSEAAPDGAGRDGSSRSEVAAKILHDALNVKPDSVSKVVDGNGEPMVVYHGSTKRFTAFDVNAQRQAFFGHGFYFTNLKDVAEYHAHKKGTQGRVISAFLNIRNPVPEDGTPKLGWQRNNDGRIINRQSGDTRFLEIVATSPEQIKSATHNTDAFGREEPGILREASEAYGGAGEDAEARRQYEAVVAAHTNADGTRKGSWMKAPDGRPTELTERQWVQVRTPNFKAWFGDWEALALINEVRGLAPVAAAAPERAAAGKAGIKESFRSFGETRNEHDGQIVRFPAGIAGKVRVQSGVKDVSRFVPAFKGAFEEAVPAFTEKPVQLEGHKGHPNVIQYSHYVGKIALDGRAYYVRFTVPVVKTDEMGNIHASTISEVEIYAEDTKGESVVRPRSKPGGNPNSPFVDTKLAQWLSSVKPEDVSQVRNANGEPMVVYHGGFKGITVFSGNENAFFFTSDRSLADSYRGYNDADMESQDITDRRSCASRWLRLGCTFRQTAGLSGVSWKRMKSGLKLPETAEWARMSPEAYASFIEKETRRKAITRPPPSLRTRSKV